MEKTEFFCDFYDNNYIEADTSIWWRFCVFLAAIGGVYDSQECVWEGGVLAESPPCLLLVACESYLTPSCKATSKNLR
jgi:hypothetical protein